MFKGNPNAAELKRKHLEKAPIRHNTKVQCSCHPEEHFKVVRRDIIQDDQFNRDINSFIHYKFNKRLLVE